MKQHPYYVTDAHELMNLVSNGYNIDTSNIKNNYYKNIIELLLEKDPRSRTDFITFFNNLNIIDNTNITHNNNITKPIPINNNLSNSNNSVDFARPGVFSQLGSGTAITSAFIDSEYVAAMWQTGSLLSAPAGTVMSILDVNFLKGSYPQNNFIDNMIVSLNRK